MHYKELIKEINEKYNSNKWDTSNLDKIYFNTINIWNEFDKVTKNKVYNMVVFLNKWKCRIPKKESLKQINSALINKDVTKFFVKLKNENLITVDLNDPKIICMIKDVFNLFSLKEVGRRKLGSTATSKIMHIINPELFIMLDEAIRKKWGCNDLDEGYINFMFRMQIEAKELIKSFSKENNIEDVKKIEREICKLCHDDMRHLTKLIDEYNYSITR